MSKLIVIQVSSALLLPYYDQVVTSIMWGFQDFFYNNAGVKMFEWFINQILLIYGARLFVFILQQIYFWIEMKRKKEVRCQRVEFGFVGGYSRCVTTVTLLLTVGAFTPSKYFDSFF
jgi:hypothetical protein